MTKPSKTMKVATTVERQVHDLFDFDPKEAHIFGVNMNGDNGEPVLGKPRKSADVYDLLASNGARSLAKNSQFIALMTCGWAAPVQDDDDDEFSDLPPSLHPKRRRVRLVVVANRKGVASVLRFQDDPDETVTDEGEARGTLAEAVAALF
jgi:hypothetical protein